MLKVLFLIFSLAISSFSLNRDGMPGTKKTLSAKSLGHGNLGVGANGRFTTDEAMLGTDLVNPNNTSDFASKPSGSLNSFSGYPFISVGLSDFLDISMVLPVYLDDIELLTGTNKTQVGDFRYKFKFQIPYFADRHIVDGAFIFGGNFGTTDKGHGLLPREIEYFETDDAPPDEKAPVFGHRKMGIDYGIGVTTDFGELAENFQLMWHNNLGVRKTFASWVDDVLYYSIAWDYRMTDFLSAYLEFEHETRFGELNSSGEFNTEPTTLSFAPRLHSPVGIDMHFGLTRAFNQTPIPTTYNNSGTTTGYYNYSARANADWEVFLGLNWNGWLIPQDDDDDGIVNSRDACPDEPEDKDKFKDMDGCPDIDNDEDGIPDTQDKCPLKPEDPDAHDDEDGCPDFDNDADGVPDLKDGCPLIAEDGDGFEDADGCPEFDNDKDGVPDSTDKCPMVAEDVDTFEDTDGCPDIDNDKDGIVDEKDKCPLKAEVVNGFQDDDGCPDEKKKVKEIVNVTLKGVNFKTGSAELTFASYQILEPVLEQLLAYPKVEIEIRGHTDNVGSARANQRLSERRAQSVVDWLVSKGVKSNRIKAVGMGETTPVASNRKASGRKENRRIEMYRVK